MNESEIRQNDPKTYERIVQSMEDYAVFTTDNEGVITTWSAGAKRVMLHNADEIIGKSGDCLYIPEDVARKVPAIEMRTALDDGKAINERFHVKADGSRFWGSGVVYPLYSDDGKHIGFTKIMRNISDEDQARKNLGEEHALAKTLVSTFREPLIILNAEMKVVNMTDAFMQYFSIGQGELVGNDFYQIIDGGINLSQLRQQLEPALKNHEFFKDMEIDYLHPRHGVRSLVVKLRRIYQPPNLLFSLEFADLTEGKAMLADGIGIPKGEQGKIFQRFGRTESIKKTKIPGTGLGLHLAAEIIKLEGGEMGFNSEAGSGSTFWFTLPLY